MTDHQKNLLFLQHACYLEEYYDIDEKKKLYSITESGIKALIVWNKIHGLKDSLGITMTFPKPISEDESQTIFLQFIENKLITKIWNSKLQTEDYPPSEMGYGIFESLKFFIDNKLQKKIARQETAKKILIEITNNFGKIMKKIGEQYVSEPFPKIKKNTRKFSRKRRSTN